MAAYMFQSLPISNTYIPVMNKNCTTCNQFTTAPIVDYKHEKQSNQTRKQAGTEEKASSNTDADKRQQS
eukprot:m.3556 g.3556  ORF g.3556 m.3556 type:complete len:69 (+) comp2085_c0_seq1:1474-1680(+)